MDFAEEEGLAGDKYERDCNKPWYKTLCLYEFNSYLLQWALSTSIKKSATGNSREQVNKI